MAHHDPGTCPVECTGLFGKRARTAEPYRPLRKSWDTSCGDLRLNYAHEGLARVLIHSGNGDLLLLLADTATASKLWKPVTEGPVLVRGPYLFRSAELRGNALTLRGDTNAPTRLDVLFPPSIGKVRWIGPLDGPPPVNLPSLTNWKFKFAAPERNPGFEDTNWRIADCNDEQPNPVREFTGSLRRRAVSVSSLMENRMAHPVTV